jgi:hypothetical protein
VELEVHSAAKDVHSFKFEVVLDPQQMDLLLLLDLKLELELELLF